jgi:Domain of unknown function (DUF1707)
MDGPDQDTAAGRGHLRAARADRERVIEVLKTAFVQERLDQDEFGARVGLALAARTYAELAALTADLPVGLLTADLPVGLLTADLPVGLAAASPPAVVASRPRAGPPRTPAQIMARSACWSVICLLVAVTLTIGGMWFFISPLVVLAVGILGHGITEALDQRRSRKQLPSGPGRGRRRPDGQPGREPAAPDWPGADWPGAEMRALQPGI